MKEDAAALSVVARDYSAPAPSIYVPADTTRFIGLEGRVKRAFDFAGAALLLALTAPLFALLALLIKRSGPGPVFYVQERLGRDGRPFRFYKFRSMKHDSDDAIHRRFAEMFINGDDEGCQRSNGGADVYKMQRDPRVTRIGAWMRRMSVDELPQLFNVLRGEMSLVGPRPPIAYEIENYQPWHMERLRVTPGLTGLWQVSGRSSVSFDEMVRLDIHYINNWSLWLDLRILLKTLPVVLRGTGGY
jgi:exopolysaccharide biosynthesis polyprenyl glycosylphosphotransferase